MKAKLHKMLSGYILSLNGDIDDPYGIVNKELADDYGWYKLSIKNCEAIERGYDLDELAKADADLRYNQPGEEDLWLTRVTGIEYGFNLALEILGDKKFSEEDMIRFMQFIISKEELGNTSSVSISTAKYYVDKFSDKLQQTEWDVEVEMICPHPSDTYRCGLQYGCDGDGCNHPKQVPYLDADGCLILKKI